MYFSNHKCNTQFLCWVSDDMKSFFIIIYLLLVFLFCNKYSSITLSPKLFKRSAMHACKSFYASPFLRRGMGQ